MVCTCFVQGWYKVGIYAWEWSLHTKHFTPFVLLTQCEQGCIQKMELGVKRDSLEFRGGYHVSVAYGKLGGGLGNLHQGDV